MHAQRIHAQIGFPFKALTPALPPAPHHTTHTHTHLPYRAARSFLPGRCQVEVPPQHAPPLLALQAPEALLQGEQAAVTVTVQAAADGIHEAVLVARALHVESQQELGLLSLASSTGEPLQTPGAEPAEGSRPPGASPRGGQLGDRPGDLQGGSRVALGELAPGQQRQVVLLLDARYRGNVDVAAELQVGGRVP